MKTAIKYFIYNYEIIHGPLQVEEDVDYRDDETYISYTFIENNKGWKVFENEVFDTLDEAIQRLSDFRKKDISSLTEKILHLQEMLDKKKVLYNNPITCREM